MALIQCKGCGNRISSKALTCPRCGGAGPQSSEAGTGATPAAERAPAVRALPVDRSPATAPASAAEPTPAVGVASAEPSPAANAQSAAPSPAADDDGLAENALIACADALFQDPLETPPQLAEEEDQETWYYVSPLGRSGPVTLAALRKLAADGHIAGDTLAWTPGLPDWIALSSYEEAAPAAVPTYPPPAGDALGSRSHYLWVLALAPAWGAILQVVATELWVATTHNRLGYYSQLWWIMLLANLLASYLDFSDVRKSDETFSKMNKYLFLQVPVYIFLRDKRLNGKPVHVWTWLASLLLWLASCLYLNSSYVRLSVR